MIMIAISAIIAAIAVISVIATLAVIAVIAIIDTSVDAENGDSAQRGREKTPGQRRRTVQLHRMGWGWGGWGAGGLGGWAMS